MPSRLSTTVCTEGQRCCPGVGCTLEFWSMGARAALQPKATVPRIVLRWSRPPTRTGENLKHSSALGQRANADEQGGCGSRAVRVTGATAPRAGLVSSTHSESRRLRASHSVPATHSVDKFISCAGAPRQGHAPDPPTLEAPRVYPSSHETDCISRASKSNEGRKQHTHVPPDTTRKGDGD